MGDEIVPLSWYSIGPVICVCINQCGTGADVPRSGYRIDCSFVATNNDIDQLTCTINCLYSS
jgi:hypothetical protein